MSWSRRFSFTLLLSAPGLGSLACGGAATDGAAPDTGATRALSLAAPFPDFPECQGLEQTRRAVCRAVLGRLTLEGAALAIPEGSSLFSTDQALHITVDTGHSCTETARLIRRRSSITVTQAQSLRLLGGFERRAAVIDVDVPVEVAVTVDAETRNGFRLLGSCIELSRSNVTLVGRLSTSVQVSVPYNLVASFAQDVTGDVNVSLQPTLSALGQLEASAVSPRVSGSASSAAALEAAALAASADAFTSANPEIGRRLREIIDTQRPAVLGVAAGGRRSYVLRRGFEERMAALGTDADLYRDLPTAPVGADHVAEMLVAPSTLAPDGVGFVRLDALDAGQLDAVLVGDTELLLNDETVLAATASSNGATRALALRSAGGFVALPPEDSLLSNVLSFRLPADQPLGPTQLSIRSRSGLSSSMPLEIVASGLHAPTSPDGIFISRSVAAHSDVFPVATDGAFDVIPELLGDERQWQYIFNLRSLCSGRAEQIGIIEGFEIFYEDDREHNGPSTCPPEAAACFPLTGTFSLDGESNLAVVDIERDDGTERYRGGWVQPTGELVNTFRGFNDDAELILTSERTGRQIRIDHRISETCR